MKFNEKQFRFICNTSKHIILEQPQVLAERITEMFIPTQNLKSRELLEHACEYPIHRLIGTLKNEDFNEKEIACCTSFISLFTKEIINQSTQHYQYRFSEVHVEPRQMVQEFTVIINDVSSYKVKHFETNFNIFLSSYKF